MLVSWMLAFASMVVGDQIDPTIYARIFMGNKPMFDQMAKSVLDNLPDNGSILDLASGPGEPSVTLAQLGRGKKKIGKLVSTDLQKEMNEKAKMRAEKAGITWMEFAVTSADDLSQFPDKSFDAVTMSFGLMFVPKKQKAMDEIYRVLKPGGFAYVSVWKELMFHQFAHEVLAEVAGKKKLPEFAINPLALKENQAVESYAKLAGLEVSKSEMLSYHFKLGTAAETADALTILAGGALQQLEKDAKKNSVSPKEKFYDIVAREVGKRGWKVGEDVAIPENKPQLLRLWKRLLYDQEL